MKKIVSVIVFMFGMINVQAQPKINDPIPYKDSLNISKITVYEVSNFICEDTTHTVIELDSFARIKKQSKFIKGKLYSEVEHFQGEGSTRFVKSIKIQEEDTKLKIPAKLYNYYEYDISGNLVLETSKTESDSILHQTRYSYNEDHSINEITYSTVAYRFRMRKPNGTIDSFEYDIKENIVKTIRIKPNGRRKVKGQDQIIKKRYDLSKVENNRLEFKEEAGKRKTRTVFKFDEKKNIISNEGYMQLQQEDGTFSIESKVYTTINKIEYRTP